MNRNINTNTYDYFEQKKNQFILILNTNTYDYFEQKKSIHIDIKHKYL